MFQDTFLTEVKFKYFPLKLRIFAAETFLPRAYSIAQCACALQLLLINIVVISSCTTLYTNTSQLRTLISILCTQTQVNSVPKPKSTLYPNPSQLCTQTQVNSVPKHKSTLYPNTSQLCTQNKSISHPYK